MTFELYLSSLILYCVLAFLFGLFIGYTTLTQTEKSLDLFGAFKKIKLTFLFEKIFSIFAKLLGIDIDKKQ